MSLPINSIAAIVIMPCFSCGNVTTQCAECAVVILIDPRTRLPIDLVLVGGELVSKPVEQSDRDRGVQALLCDACVVAVRARKPGHIGDTATERHARGVCANAR